MYLELLSLLKRRMKGFIRFPWKIEHHLHFKEEENTAAIEQSELQKHRH